METSTDSTETITTDSSSNLDVIPFALSAEQQGFIDRVVSADKPNVLLIGKAGVGKSTAVRSLIDYADENSLHYVRLAPTGKAAINIGGETVHRFIRRARDGRNANQIKALDFVLIDEISMVRADLLDELSSVLKGLMLNNDPFGGLQFIAVGDPGQLPPVIESKGDDRKYLERHYRTAHFFGADSFYKLIKSEKGLEIIELETVFRQEGVQFPKLLNLIRAGKSEKPLQYLNKFRHTNEPKGVILTGRNADADTINQRELQKLPTSSVTYRAVIQGDLKSSDYPADETLTLKIGARVMVIKNVYHGEQPDTYLELVNGDTGIVTDLTAHAVTIHCDRTDDEHVLTSDCGVWEKRESKMDEKSGGLEKILKGTFIQIPLRLAWAITIHKAQGATIQEVTVDFRKPMFAAGQAYVALSRATALERLWILGKIRPRDVKLCEEVADFLLTHLESRYIGNKKGGKFDISEEEITEKEEKKKIAADNAMNEMMQME